MKHRWIVGAAVFSSFALIAMKFFARTEPAAAPSQEAAERLEELPEDLSRQEPVGWVFGRVVGFPRADRPLTGQPGSFGGTPLPPTHSFSK